MGEILKTFSNKGHWKRGLSSESLLVPAHGVSQSMTGTRKVQILCSGTSKNSLRILSHKLWTWFDRNHLLISLFCQCCDCSRTFYFSCSQILPPGAQLSHFQEFVVKFSMILKCFSFYIWAVNSFFSCLWVSRSIDQYFLYRNFPLSNILNFYWSSLSTALQSVSFTPWNNLKFCGSLPSIRMQQTLHYQIKIGWENL